MGERPALSLNMPPEECVNALEAMGLPRQMLEVMRRLVGQGIHPLQVLQIFQERKVLSEEKRQPMLESFDIDGIARYIKEKGCKRVVVMCGAGISTSAGIPDFRSPGTGLYDNLQRFNLPSPDSMFDIDYFRCNPAPFYELIKELWPGHFAPTPAHFFLKLLHDKNILLRCYTQNIDSLERQAGLPEEKIVAAHGNFDGAHVVQSRFSEEREIQVDIAELKRALDRGEEGWQALRKEKGGLVKPNIVFFGEPLPHRFIELHLRDLANCDLLIVLGTSLAVAPFNSLVGQAPATAPRLLVNRDSAGTCDELTNGFRFHLTEEGQNWRDVWHQGDCDSGCRALAAALGWAEDLEALIRSRVNSAASQGLPAAL